MTYKQYIELSNWQRQIVYGTLFGNSMLIRNNRNAHLVMRSRNQKWVQCKSQELINFLPQNPILACGNGNYIWHSICSPVFNEIYDSFYIEGKKTANKDILNNLQAIGLAVWFLDCGKIKETQITMKVIIDNKEIVYQYFKDLDFSFELDKNKIKFSEESSKKFMKIIGESIPQFMR